MLYFVRHGQTDWNLKNKMQGHANISLNKTGISQAENLKKELQNINIDYVFCSPLLRALQTYENAFTEKKNIPFIIDNRLIERDFGEFEGLSKTEFDFLEFFNPNTKTKYISAEPFASVKNRLFSFFDSIKNLSDKNICIISHGGIIITLTILLKALSSPNEIKQIQFLNCKLIELDYNDILKMIEKNKN